MKKTEIVLMKKILKSKFKMYKIIKRRRRRIIGNMMCGKVAKMEWSLGIRFETVLLALNPQIYYAFFCHLPRLSWHNQLSISMFSLDLWAQTEVVTKWILQY